MRQRTKGKVKASAVIALFLGIMIAFSYLVMYGYGDGHILSARNIDLGLDLQGGVSILYEADLDNPTMDDMKSAEALIRERLDRDGYTDAEVSISGTNRLAVDIPGVEDANEAINSIGASAQLTFADVDGNVYLTGDDVANAKMARQPNQITGVQEIVVVLEFSSEGQKKFYEATKACG